MLRQLEALSRIREAEANAMVARAERMHPGAIQEALKTGTILRETLADQIGLNRSHLSFVDGLLESGRENVPLSQNEVNTRVEECVRENIGHLHLVVRLVATAGLRADAL
jgi:hypothetical protein